MSKPVRLFLSLLMGIFGFLFLNKEYQLVAYDIPMFSVPYGQVRVDFINESSEDIKSITIDKLAEPIVDIVAGERRSVVFDHTAGEGSYKYKVVFASGKEIEGGNSYIETGYFEKERIK